MKTSYYLVTAAGLTVAAVVVYTQQSGRSGARELPPAATAQAKPSEPAEPAPFALAEMSLPPVVTPPDAPLVIPAANQAPVRPLPPMTVEPAIAAPTTPAAPLPQPQAAPSAPVAQPSTPAPLPIPPVISSPATPASPPPGTPAIPVISPIAPPTTLANPVPEPATPIAPVVVPPAPAENAAPETPIKPIAPAAPAVPPAIPPSAPVSPPLPAAPQAGSSGEKPAAPIAPESPAVLPQQPVIQPNPTLQPTPMKPKSDAVSTPPQSPPVAPRPAAVLPQPAPLPKPSAQPKPLPLLPAPRRETAAPAAPGESKFIVVKGNKLIEGSISVIGEKAMIRQGSLERSMPKTDVLFVGETKDEVYRFMLAKFPPNDAAGRLGVARWCMFAGMREQALAEAREVLKLAPGNPSATQLVRTLEESLKLYPSDGSTPLATARPTGGTLEAEPDVDLTAEGATTFASHAQPVLANKCMECHARPNYPGSFKLIRVTGFEVGPQSTKANMRSTAAQLKKEDPLNSPLLAKSLVAHGGMKQPAFVSRQAAAYRILESWVQVATPPVAPPMATPVPPTAIATPAPAPGEAPKVPQIPLAGDDVPAQTAAPASPVQPVTPMNETPTPASVEIPLPPSAEVPGVVPPAAVPERVDIPIPGAPAATIRPIGPAAEALPVAPLPHSVGEPGGFSVPIVLPTPPDMPMTEVCPKHSKGVAPAAGVKPAGSTEVASPAVAPQPREKTKPAAGTFGIQAPPKPAATSPTGHDEFDPAGFNRR